MNRVKDRSSATSFSAALSKKARRKNSRTGQALMAAPHRASAMSATSVPSATRGSWSVLRAGADLLRLVALGGPLVLDGAAVEAHRDRLGDDLVAVVGRIVERRRIGRLGGGVGLRRGGRQACHRVRGRGAQAA